MIVIAALTLYFIVWQRYASVFESPCDGAFVGYVDRRSRFLSSYSGPVIAIIFIACLLAMGVGQGHSGSPLSMVLALTEPCLAVCFLQRRDISCHARLIAFWGIVAIWATQSQGAVGGNMVTGHFLAPYHIFCSRVAKAYLLCAMAVGIGGDATQSQFYWRKASWLVATSIVLGMIWAHDASDWGAFWQWDYIELSQLAIFVAAVAASRRAHEFWTVCVAILWGLQWIIVYQLPDFGIVTRHQYGHGYGYMAHLLGSCALMIAYIACATLVGKISSHRLHCRKDGVGARALPQAHVVAGVALLCIELIFGIFSKYYSENSLFHGILYIAFGAIWAAICWGMPPKRYIVSISFAVVAMIGAAWGNGKIESSWVGIDGAINARDAAHFAVIDDMRLHGIRVELDSANSRKDDTKIDDCRVYWVEISIGARSEEESIYETSFEAGARLESGSLESNRVRAPADVFYRHRWYRVSTAAYDARYGALVFVRDRTFAAIWMIYFMGLCVFGLVWVRREDCFVARKG